MGVQLMSLLLNPAGLLCTGEPSAAILTSILPEPPAGSSGSEAAAPPEAAPGKKLGLSSMVLRASTSDPQFLMRVGLSNYAGTLAPSSVSECACCGAPLVGKMGITQLGMDF